MSPRIGRPPIENPKNEKINIRITKETSEDLQYCADRLGTSRANVIVMGIQKVKSEIDTKK